MQPSERGEGFDARDDERFEGLDESPVGDAGAVVPDAGGAAAVLDDEIERLEAGGGAARVEGGVAGGGEERAADAAGEGEGFELRGDAAEVVADVVRRVEVAPFVGGGRFFAVEAFEADVDVRERRGEGL